MTASTISRLRQLLDSEQSRVQDMVETLSNGVIMFNLNRFVTLANPAAQKMTGLPAKGFYLSELLKLFASGEMEEKINQVLLRGIPMRIPEITIVHFTYEFSIVPIHDHEHKIVGAALIIHDITHIKEVDKAKTEFVSLASHQLRTPLSTVSWYVEMLLTGDAGELNKEQKKYLDEVYKGNKRMVDLVNALLNVSRLELGTFVVEPEPTDAVALARSVMDEQKPQIKAKELKLSQKYADNLPKLKTDPKLLRMVLQNFLSNAVKYTPERGKVKIKITLSGAKGQRSNVLIKISDTGYGIPKNQQDKIFPSSSAPTTFANKTPRGLDWVFTLSKPSLTIPAVKFGFPPQEDPPWAENLPKIQERHFM